MKNDLSANDKSDLSHHLVRLNIQSTRALAWALLVFMIGLTIIQLKLPVKAFGPAASQYHVYILILQAVLILISIAFLTLTAGDREATATPRNIAVEFIFNLIVPALLTVQTGILRLMFGSISSYLILILVSAFFIRMNITRRLILFPTMALLMTAMILGLGSFSPLSLHHIISANAATIIAFFIATATYAQSVREFRYQRTIELQIRELERLSLVDGLTGAANRRYFDEHLSEEWRRAVRAQKPLALIMADLDLFKSLNDTYGHQYGDRCLKEVAGALMTLVNRPGDLVSRYGGEEFVVVLPGADLQGAGIIAEKMRQAVENLDLKHTHCAGGRLTISIGLAVMATDPVPPETLLSQADRALYRAKEAGRNRVAEAQ